MISSLRGKIIEKNPTDIVVDCNGVGYQVFISLSTYDKLPRLNDEVMIKTLFIPRDDAFYIYGFIDDTEREAFRQLISISGVGAKTAIAILSSLTVIELRNYILTANAPALNKLPGIGKKTAERLILELKDKISKLDINVSLDGAVQSDIVKQEAILALVALGFSTISAEKAVTKIISSVTDDVTVESLIRMVLKKSGS